MRRSRPAECARRDLAPRHPTRAASIVVWCPSGVQCADQARRPGGSRGSSASRSPIPSTHRTASAAAKQAALQKEKGSGISLQDRIKFGDNIQSTMQYARTGAVDAAIVALSLAVVTDGRTRSCRSIRRRLRSARSAAGGVRQGRTRPTPPTRLVDVHPIARRAARVMTRYGFLLPTRSSCTSNEAADRDMHGALPEVDVDAAPLKLPRSPTRRRRGDAWLACKDDPAVDWDAAILDRHPIDVELRAAGRGVPRAGSIVRRLRRRC